MLDFPFGFSVTNLVLPSTTSRTKISGFWLKSFVTKLLARLVNSTNGPISANYTVTTPGWYRIRAAFADHPMEVSDVEAAVRAAADSGGLASRLGADVLITERVVDVRP